MYKTDMDYYLREAEENSGIVITKSCEDYKKFRKELNKKKEFVLLINKKITKGEMFIQYCWNDEGKEVIWIVAPIKKMIKNRKIFNKVLKLCQENGLEGPIAFIN